MNRDVNYSELILVTLVAAVIVFQYFDITSPNLEFHIRICNLLVHIPNLETVTSPLFKMLIFIRFVNVIRKENSSLHTTQSMFFH